MISKVLMVTDQPFWRAQNGAHQRMLSLVRYMLSQQFEIVVFYMVNRSKDDVEKSKTLGCRFVDYVPEGGLAAKFATAIKNASRTLRGGVGPSAVERDLKAVKNQLQEQPFPPPLTLSDYRWPHAAEQFRQVVRSERPAVVLVEYVTWAYLLQGLEGSKVKSIIDTHDALHVRNAQFKKNGKQHWIDISREEESAELKRFDLIMAIQAEEAELFREMAPDSQLMVVGHVPVYESARSCSPASDRSHDDKCEPHRREPVKLGFIGSDNDANVDGMTWFITECWDDIRARAEHPVQLIIGGPIRASLETRLEQQLADTRESITFMGAVESVADFYEPLDFVINPVRFGSGLKIKSVEAFVYGKPLVTTGHSMSGMPAQAKKAALASDSVNEFVDSCVKLINDPKLIEARSAESRMIGAKLFSAESVYSDFADWIRRQSAKSAS